jgi:hypothetical protein
MPFRISKIAEDMQKKDIVIHVQCYKTGPMPYPQCQNGSKKLMILRLEKQQSEEMKARYMHK